MLHFWQFVCFFFTKQKLKDPNYLLMIEQNRPVPSTLVPLFQNKAKCETFHMKMSSACSFIFMQIKVIFIRMVWHFDSLWNRGTRELGNGLLNPGIVISFTQLICNRPLPIWLTWSWDFQNKLLYLVLFNFIQVSFGNWRTKRAS